MALVVSKSGVGRVCASEDPLKIKESIGMMLRSPVTREQFEILRNDLMGGAQVQQLKSALTGKR